MGAKVFIQRCSNSGDIAYYTKAAQPFSYFYYGGIAGYLSNSAYINGCKNTGNIDSSANNLGDGTAAKSEYIGGLVGYTQNGASVFNSYSLGTLRGSTLYSYGGGLVGKMNSATEILSSCYFAKGAIWTTTAMPGYCQANASAKIENCYSHYSMGQPQVVFFSSTDWPTYGNTVAGWGSIPPTGSVWPVEVPWDCQWDSARMGNYVDEFNSVYPKLYWE